MSTEDSVTMTDEVSAMLYGFAVGFPDPFPEGITRRELAAFALGVSAADTIFEQRLDGKDPESIADRCLGAIIETLNERFPGGRR
mgnify:CR=1 FL=1